MTRDECQDAVEGWLLQVYIPILRGFHGGCGGVDSAGVSRFEVE